MDQYARDRVRTGRTPDPLRQVAKVTAWLSEEAVSGLSGVCVWHVSSDTDGALLLVPESDVHPGFAIIPADGGALGVLVADPDEGVELGPFASLEEALHAITTWVTAHAWGQIGHA